MRDRWPRVIAAAALALVVVFPGRAAAQAGLGHLDDASVVPAGLLRARVGVAWTRSDSRFTGFGIEPLGSSLTADSLGSQRFTPLAPLEALIGTASGAPFMLSLGASRLDALAREEILPLSLEFGLTNRVTIGVMVPVVRKRASVQFQLDSAGANVGPNLHRTSTAAQQNNITVQTQFASAAQQLRDRLDFCAANPGAAGCPELLARASEAQTLLGSSADFATTAATLFGSADSQGQAFVPMSQTLAQLAIAQRVAEFNAQYRDLLGAGSDLLTAVPTGAAGPAGTVQFQQYLFSELGRDSLVMRERVGYGDIEFAVKALVLDRPATADRRFGRQLAVQGGVRLPTGSRQSMSNLVDLSLGTGALTLDARAFADLSFGRAGLLASAAFHSTGADSPVRGDRRVTAFHIAPRWHLSAPLSVHGAYTRRDGDVSESTQLVGGGVSFMKPDALRSGGRLPIEMRFTHLEAISGAVGQPKYFRDQIEVRIYNRLLQR